MNAAVVRSFDAVPCYGTFEDPVAREGELLVRVTAAGLHPIVKALANGTHYGSTGELPFVPGVDGVGRLEDGTRVYFGAARRPFGTFAEHSLAAKWICLPLPEQLDDVTAAGIANPAMSAWMALKERAGFVAGESLLILGATGVAGQLAVQIAKRFGAQRVIATGRNLEALEKLKELGADAIVSVDQSAENLAARFRGAWADGDVHVVLDYLWGPPAETLLDAITQKGFRRASSRVRYIQIGESAGPRIGLNAATLRSSGLELLGSGFGSVSLDQIRQGIGEFFESAAKKPFRFGVKTAALRDVQALWNQPARGMRLVFGA